MFLEKVAFKIFQKFKNYQNTYIILPNRRSVGEIKHYIKKHITPPNWLPKIMAIRDFVYLFSDLKEVDTFKLLLLLFDTYKEKLQNNKKIEHFEDFLFLGQHILADFNSIKKELDESKIKKMFYYISEIKKIETIFDFLDQEQKAALEEFWSNVQNTDDTNIIKQYFQEFWKMLYPIFLSLNEQLSKNGVGYEALAYRQTQAKLSAMQQEEIPEFCFVGFNALTKVQYEIFDFLKKKGKAYFFWDYDERFNFSKSASFVQENIKLFGNDLETENNSNSSISTTFEEYPVSSETVQIDILSKILNENVIDSEKTCVVLNNEKLLLPLSKIIFEDTNRFNISTGLPVSFLPTIQFLELLIELKEVIRKNNTIPYSLLLNLLNSSFGIYLEKNFFQDVNLRKYITNEIISKKISHLSYAFLKEHLPKDLYLLLKQSEIKQVINTWICFFQNVLKKTNEINNTFYGKLIIHTIKFLEKLDIYIKELPAEFKSLKKIFKFFIHKEKVHFKTFSENQKSNCRVQIMGLLETQLLDFDNIIFLSANDEYLPELGQSNSLIPIKIKKVFELPSIENQEIIYSYTFYRLLYRAQKVFFIYNAIQDDFNKGEKSRFIYQLKFQPKIKNFKRYSLETTTIFLTQNQPIIIEKTQEVLSETEKISDFSPSALTSFLDCPLKYYFKHIKHLKEPETIDDDISYQNIGIIFHDVISELLNEGYYTASSIEKIQNNKAKIDEIIRKNFCKQYKIDEKKEDINNNGIFIFFNEVLRSFIQKSLTYDKQFSAPFEILGVEKKIEYSFKMNINGKEQDIKLKGTIDRYDKRKDKIHIIDYKTGKIRLDYQGLDALFKIGYEDSEKTLKKRDSFFQLLFYALLLNKKENYTTFVLRNYSLVMSMQTNEDTYIAYNKQLFEVNQNILEDFERKLNQLITNILEKDFPFKQSLSKKCDYCLYKRICYT